MLNPDPTPDLDVSQLSAVQLQRLGITVAQVRAVYGALVVVIGPKAESAFPGVWQVLGFTSTGRFIFVALRYDDHTGKFAALGVEVAGDLAELRYFLCRA